jgi:hypothetical protein
MSSQEQPSTTFTQRSELNRGHWNPHFSVTRLRIYSTVVYIDHPGRLLIPVAKPVISLKKEPLEALVHSYIRRKHVHATVLVLPFPDTVTTPSETEHQQQNNLRRPKSRRLSLTPAAMFGTSRWHALCSTLVRLLGTIPHGWTKY